MLFQNLGKVIPLNDDDYDDGEDWGEYFMRNELPTLEALLCLTLRKQGSNATKHALQTTDRRSLREGAAMSTPHGQYLKI